MVRIKQQEQACRMIVDSFSIDDPEVARVAGPRVQGEPSRSSVSIEEPHRQTGSSIDD